MFVSQDFFENNIQRNVLHALLEHIQIKFQPHIVSNALLVQLHRYKVHLDALHVEKDFLAIMLVKNATNVFQVNMCLMQTLRIVFYVLQGHFLRISEARVASIVLLERSRQKKECICAQIVTHHKSLVVENDNAGLAILVLA